MMNIKIFTNGGGAGVGGIFSLLITILFYQCNDKTLYISSFIVVYVIYFTHSLYCCVLVFSPFPEKLTFFCKKCIFSYSFWLIWLKQISFYRELNYLHMKVFNFFIFYLFPVKQTKKQNL